MQSLDPECECNEYTQMASLTEEMLSTLGFDIVDPGFIDTPHRVASFWLEFTQRSEPEIRTFPSNSTSLVRLENYETWGLCPHHLLPVKYSIDICYTPCGTVFGISKLPRIADYCLRTLPLQEDLPKQIVEFITSKLDVNYAQCTVRGMHLCMVMRGVRARDCELTTSYETYGPTSDCTPYCMED